MSITQVLREIFPLDICKLILVYLIPEIINIKTLSYSNCRRCYESGAFCNLQMGGDYITCPKCDHYFSSDDQILTSSDNIYEDYVYMCPKCTLIFDNHCSHAVNGCSDDVYYAQLVTGFRLDGAYFEGSPKFNNIQEIEVIARTCKIELILDCWSTINGRTFCPEAYYKYDKTPSSYYSQICKQTIFKFLKISLKS